MLRGMATKAETPRETRFGRQLGQNIRARRLARNLTIQDVADKLGRCRNTVDRWERAEVIPPMIETLRLTYVLKCRFEELLPRDA